MGPRSGVYLRGTLALVCAWLLFSPVLLAQESISTNALMQIQAMSQEKASWTPAERKMDSHLILAAKRQMGRNIVAGVPPLRAQVTVDESGRTQVDIRAAVTNELLAFIAAQGGTVENVHPEHDAIRADIPLDRLQDVAARNEVRWIRMADQFATNKVNTSEGDVAHGADVARTAFGVNGTGVKVGILSDGVDSIASLQATGDLPAGVTIIPGQAGSGDEGSAMLEIVYDLAPGAQLYFATALGGQAQFASNIQALKAAGCNIICDDVFYFAEGVFQDGIIAQAVDTVTAGGASYFSSAGNGGNLNDGTSGVYEGLFSSAGTTLPAVLTGAGSAHNFGGGLVYDQITKDPPFGMTLQWADPLGASSNDYDLYLLNSSLNTILDASTATQDGSQDPFEYIDSGSFNDLGLRLVVIKYSGSDRVFSLNTMRGELAVATDSQISGHCAAVGALAVAAVDVRDAPGGIGHQFDGSEPVETFSSDGPRSIYFDASGTPLGSVEVRNKPEITAADGVSCAAPGFNPFYGTSAAAPHAAALAALLIEQGISTTPAEIRSVMTSTAIDIEAAGFDRDSGYGIVDVLAALSGNCALSIDPQTRSIGPSAATGLTIAVTADPNCSWTATSNDPFITITSGSTGTGNGTVTYDVEANGSSARSGTITVTGQIHTVNQSSCDAAVVVTNPSDQNLCTGGNAAFTAAAGGDPVPAVQWQRNTGGGFADLAGQTSTTLNINGVTPAMNDYQYRAVFTNSCGSATTLPATLRVGAPVGPLMVSATDGTDPNKVVVTWSSIYAATGYRVFRSTNADMSGAVDISGVVTGTSFDDTTAKTVTTGVLSCKKTTAIQYYYGVKSVNACGDGSISATDAGELALPAGAKLADLGDWSIIFAAMAAVYFSKKRRRVSA